MLTDRNSEKAMASNDPPDVTRLLMQMKQGDAAAVENLLPLVYDELHALAHRQRFKWRDQQTVNTTALVHECYLQMIDQAQVDWNDRAHFFCVAAQAMRYILMNYVRAKRRDKRGGDQQRVEMSKAELVTEEQEERLLALDEALGRLAQENDRQRQIVECRFFGGMKVEETAAALGLSPATVKRDWALARVWLYRQLKDDGMAE